MTSDDQYFLDQLSSIPQEAARYGNRLAEFIERQVDAIASEIKSIAGIIDSNLPRSFSPADFRPPPPPKSLVEKTQDWISEHRTAVAIAVAFTSTTIYLLHRRRRLERRKRRAKRGPNNCKKEVLVLASTIYDPLARSLAIDLERRGFLVYMTVSSQAEENLVNVEAKPDIRPLYFDLTSTVPNPSVDIHPNLAPIHDLLSKPSSQPRQNDLPAFQYQCTLAGLIVMPATDYARTPLMTLSSSDLIDTINTRLISPMLTIQQFLPLMSSTSHPTSIIMVYPSISSSLNPPLQTVFAASTSALSSFARSLRSEIQLLHAKHAQPIQVTEIRLGNIDLGTTPTFSKRQNASQLESLAQFQSHSPSPSRRTAQQALPWHWHSSERAQALRQTFGQVKSIRGSPVRVFHNAVFDTLYAAKFLTPPASQTWGQWILSLNPTDSGPGGVVYAGRGARIYDHLSRNVHPRSLVDWIVRWRCRRDGWGVEGNNGDLESGKARRHEPTSSLGSMEGSTGSESAVWEKV